MTDFNSALEQVLDAASASDLAWMYRHLGLAKAPSRKADLIRALQDYFARYMDEFPKRLSADEARLLTQIAYTHGRFDPEHYVAKYGAPCPGLNQYGGVEQHTVLKVFTVRERESGMLVMPEPIAERLRQVLPPPPPVKIASIEEMPATLDVLHRFTKKVTGVRPVQVSEGEQRVIRELPRILSLAQSGKIALTAKGRRPTEAAVRLVSASLAEPDFQIDLPTEQQYQYYEEAGPIRAHAWPVLLQNCGWAKARKERLVLTEAGARLLGGFDPEAFADGVANLLSDDQFDELNRIEHIRGQSGRAAREMTSPSERRQAIADGMAKWPVGRWIALDEAYRALLATGFVFNVSLSPWYLYLEEQQYGHFGSDRHPLNRQYLRVFLFESLGTLGLVDVAYVNPHDLWPELGDGWGSDEMPFCGRYDGLLTVRINNLGAFCLGMRDEYHPPESQPRRILTILPNHEIAIVGNELLPGDQLTLERFARKTADRTWRIDREKILDLLASGGSLDEIRQFVRTAATNEMPENLSRFLEDVERRSRAVVGIEEALLVTLVDEETAALVAHDSQAGKICRPAGGKAVAVPKSRMRSFRTAMKNLGFIVPRGEGEHS